MQVAQIRKKIFIILCENQVKIKWYLIRQVGLSAQAHAIGLNFISLFLF